MKIILTAAIAIGLLAGPGGVWAGVPMDSFNSANAALAPSQAIGPKIKKGPAQALVAMAEKRRQSKTSDGPSKP
jgi:hypothetical protein